MHTKILDNTITNEIKSFHQKIYTPLSEAIEILEARQKDPVLREKIEKLLNGNIPEPLKKIGKHGVHFRQIATPNADARWFIELTQDHGLHTVFFEYHKDKFTSNNYFKHSLGQLQIYCDVCNKKGEFIKEKITIVDFAKYDGKKLDEVETLESGSLVDFHRKLFNFYYPENKSILFDLSNWVKENGGEASTYYFNFLLLFLTHGILFENFLLVGSEGRFTRETILPSFEKIMQLTGMKPLIVPIPPMDEEGSQQGFSYEKDIKSMMKTI